MILMENFQIVLIWMKFRKIDATTKIRSTKSQAGTYKVSLDINNEIFFFQNVAILFHCAIVMKVYSYNLPSMFFSLVYKEEI